MPLLKWSPAALAVLQNEAERKAMMRLFDAYFRVAGEGGREALTRTILHLDSPTQSKQNSLASLPVGALPRSRRTRPGAPLARPDKDRYHFYATFTKKDGWVVQAVLKLEYRVMATGADLR